MPNLQNYTANRTPIEIALDVDNNGMTTAKNLYQFLELNPAAYARWCKHNILENEFAEESVDYWVYNVDVENLKGGRPTQDFKLTASFAKKLSMTQKNHKGEDARKYFVKVEDKLKQTVKQEMTPEMLVDRQELLASTVELMGVKDKFGLELSVSDEVYKLATGKKSAQVG